MESAPGPETVIDGRRYLYFGGTGYLGLAGHPEVIEAACSAVRRYGIHTATSRHGFGNNPLTLEVERRAAEFFDLEDAFYLPSGYLGNHAILPVLSEKTDIFLIDEIAHYSLFEAAQLAGKPLIRFKHGNTNDLEQRIQGLVRPGQRLVVLSDGVSPVSGAVAPIREYVNILSRYAPAGLHLDDAHGFAVLGKQGRGVVEHFGFWNPKVNSFPAPQGVAISVCGSLAKGLGGYGGIIPGSHSILERARQVTHYYEGASAPSSANAGATAKALEILKREPGLRQQLQDNIRQLRSGLRALGLDVSDEPTANFCLRLGDTARMQSIHQRLKAEDILVPYMNHYVGLAGQGALRFAVCALHTPAMIDRLLWTLRKIL